MKTRPIIPVAMLLATFYFSCTDMGGQDDYSSIADPLSRWRAYNMTNYSLKQTRNCYCLYGGQAMTVVVRQNAIANVINLSTGSSIPRNEWAWYRTADELFQTVAQINRDTVAQFILEYDPKYGFPRFLYVDFSENWADEEFGYITQFVSRD